MKKYWVSLALKVYSNFETNVEAESKEKALDIALEQYSNGSYEIENITEPDWSDSEIDIGENDEGVCIEEIHSTDEHP